MQELLREIDPDGSELRKTHRLKKRKYHNPGPNYAWHSEGMITLSHMDSKFMAALTAGAARLCGCM